MIASRFSTSWPIRRGPRVSRIAATMESWLSPVITAVGGALPKPTSPLSASTLMTMSSAESTRRKAVLNGRLSGMLTRPM